MRLYFSTASPAGVWRQNQQGNCKGSFRRSPNRSWVAGVQDVDMDLGLVETARWNASRSTSSASYDGEAMMMMVTTDTSRRPKRRRLDKGRPGARF
jgi:hypothetical protein